MTQSDKLSYAISYFYLRFWLSVGRKWSNLNLVITTSGTLNVEIGECKQTTVFDDNTVMSLLEGVFAMSTLPFFLFYMLDLWLCKWFIGSVWAVCEATWLAQGKNICIRIRLFTSFSRPSSRWQHSSHLKAALLLLALCLATISINRVRTLVNCDVAFVPSFHLFTMDYFWGKIDSVFPL